MTKTKILKYSRSEHSEVFNGKKIIETIMVSKCKKIWSDGDEYIHSPSGGLGFILEDTSGVRSMVVLGYTEIGEWIEYNGPVEGNNK